MEEAIKEDQILLEKYSLIITVDHNDYTKVRWITRGLKFQNISFKNVFLNRLPNYKNNTGSSLFNRSLFGPNSRGRTDPKNRAIHRVVKNYKKGFVTVHNERAGTGNPSGFVAHRWNKVKNKAGKDDIAERFTKKGFSQVELTRTDI